MAVHVIDEANRCLNCKKPMCRGGCPINTPIPKMIEEFKNNRLNDAGELLFNNNPLSIVCSLVCDHDKQCEGHCILGKKGAPVHISSIENYISDSYFDKMIVDCAPSNGKKVAIIGSGPAGITIAVYLTQLGYSITIFEAREKIGGVMQYGIPEFRLPKSILERYKKKLIQLGVKIRPNATIGGALEIEELLRDGYKSIFIGTGVWRPKKLGIKGETLGNVHFAIDYLVNPESFDLGKNIAIIGMGNAAIDVARTALRHGASKVTLYARGPKASASKHEIAYAKLDGANFEFNKEIQEITDRGPIFKDAIYDEEDNFIEYTGESNLVEVDSIIISISQGPKDKLILTTDGLKASTSGHIVTNEYGETTREGVFAAGDVVRGAKTVVEAVAYSKQVAQAMHQYMMEQD